MATKTRKRKKAKVKADARFDRPTPEREQHNAFRSAGPARAVTPVIDTLHKDRRISQAQWAALLYYRQQADACHRSPVRDSCDFSVRGGNGDGPLVSRSSAKLEVERMDKALGELQPLVWAVAVEDKSLTQWCISRHGGRERYRNGRFLEIVPRGANNGSFKIDVALWELKFAASRLEGG